MKDQSRREEGVGGERERERYGIGQCSQAAEITHHPDI